jgi:hypothetical protein
MPNGPVMRDDNEGVERHPRRPLDHAAEDVGVVTVDPRLARLRNKGQ